MPRAHASLKTTIWNDDDFRRLPAASQRLYMLLLSQPKLTLCGGLDLLPARWAQLAPDTPLEAIEEALRGLEEAGFVIVDRVTEELLIRSFAKHDLQPSRLSKSVIAGFWSAWGQMLSPALRGAALQLPDPLWTRLSPGAPEEARLQKPRSSPLEWARPLPSERESPPPFESPVTCHRSPKAAGKTQDTTDAESRARAACLLAAEAEIEQRRAGGARISSPAKVAALRADDLWELNGHRLAEMARFEPEWSPAQLLEELARRMGERGSASGAVEPGKLYAAQEAARRARDSEDQEPASKEQARSMAAGARSILRPPGDDA